MPQQKRTGSSQAKRSSSSTKSTTRRSSSGGKSTGRKSSSGAPSEQQSEDALLASLSALRQTLAEGVVLSSARIQDAMDDAVRRGKVTTDDAQDIVTRLVNSGRQQTRDLLDEIEALVTRGRDTIEDTARTAAGRARKAPGSDRVLKEVDRARRVAGLGPSFPITDYENLTAAEINSRLDELSPAELRKVRDHEKRNANRKTVLEAVEKRLA